MKYFTLSFTLLLSFSIISTSFALPTKDFDESTESIKIDDASSKVLTKKEFKKYKRQIKKQDRFEKRMAWFSKIIQKKMAKKAIDLDDPVEKWMWFWILGWGAAIVFSILGILGFIGWLAGVAGTVCLVIWLVKRYS